MESSDSDNDHSFEPGELTGDSCVKVAGIDVDGMLRGKLMSKKKFLSIADDGFGFCSVIFGWDMHDQTYFRELKISNKENGYRDVMAVPDFKSYRRIPWEKNKTEEGMGGTKSVPFILVDFLDPETKKPICACPRSLLKSVMNKLYQQNVDAMAGGETFLAGMHHPKSTWDTNQRHSSAKALYADDSCCSGI